MTFYPAAAYGIGFAMIVLLTICGVQNRRAGYRRERYDLVTENLELWQSMQQTQEVVAVAPPVAQCPAPAPTTSIPVEVLQDQMAYHAIQLSQLQNALAAAGTPSVRPQPAAVPDTAGKKDEIRIA